MSKPINPFKSNLNVNKQDGNKNNNVQKSQKASVFQSNNKPKNTNDNFQDDISRIYDAILEDNGGANFSKTYNSKAKENSLNTKQIFKSKIDESTNGGELTEVNYGKKVNNNSKKQEVKTTEETETETVKEIPEEDDVSLNNEKKEVSEKDSPTSDLFSSDVKMTREFLKDEKTGMQYFIMAPEGTDPKKDELPMLLYLHGGTGGKYGKYSFQAMKSSPGFFLQDTNFKGYIVCPALEAGKIKWDDEQVAENLDNFLTSFCDSHKVNKDKIALSGVSLGGSGTVYMANKLKKWFCKAAAISPARGELDTSSSKVPLKLFFGSNDDKRMFKYIKNELSQYDDADINYVGNRDVKEERVTHTWAAAKAYEIDNNQDGVSDLLQWLFS